ncbi:MAG TPA: hypothetical protein VF755_27485 [Catenuloplanes sp.]
MTYAFDPEVAAGIPTLPALDVSDLPEARRLNAEMMAAAGEPDDDGVTVSEHLVPGPAGAPPVGLRVYRPDRVGAPAGLYNVHGGGFVLGDLDSDHARMLERHALRL